MRSRGATMATLLVLTVASGCTGGSNSSASPTTSAATSTTSPSASTTAPLDSVAPATTSAAGATTTTVKSSGSRCPTASLSLSLVDLGAAAGTAYRELVFTNRASQACTMQGYPGVSFIDSHGAQIGAPVPRMTGAGGLVTLAAGGTAAALLAYHDVYVATFPGCRPTAAAGIRAYPPDETASLTAATSILACANPAASATAGISPVTMTASLHP